MQYFGKTFSLTSTNECLRAVVMVPSQPGREHPTWLGLTWRLLQLGSIGHAVTVEVRACVLVVAVDVACKLAVLVLTGWG